jgi:hypothetical protein
LHVSEAGTGVDRDERVKLDVPAHKAIKLGTETGESAEDGDADEASSPE